MTTTQLSPRQNRQNATTATQGPAVSTFAQRMAAVRQGAEARRDARRRRACEELTRRAAALEAAHRRLEAVRQLIARRGEDLAALAPGFEATADTYDGRYRYAMRRSELGSDARGRPCTVFSRITFLMGLDAQGRLEITCSRTARGSDLDSAATQLESGQSPGTAETFLEECYLDFARQAL